MSAEATTRQRRGISIFRAEEATPILETDFMAMPAMNDEQVAAGAPEIYMDSAPGTDVRVAVRQTPEEGGFSILHVWFKADYPVPRHTHDADCLYYIVSGSAILGSQTLRPGDGFFIPAGAPYGYDAGPEGVELLEIRHNAWQFDIRDPRVERRQVGSHGRHHRQPPRGMDGRLREPDAHREPRRRRGHADDALEAAGQLRAGAGRAARSRHDCCATSCSVRR